jgi:hypothetical protein
VFIKKRTQEELDDSKIFFHFNFLLLSHKTLVHGSSVVEGRA